MSYRAFGHNPSWVKAVDYDALAARLAQLEQEQATFEEREAACCPEDVGFEEWIATLIKQRDRADAALGEIRQALQQLQKEHDELLARVGPSVPGAAPTGSTAARNEE